MLVGVRVIGDFGRGCFGFVVGKGQAVWVGRAPSGFFDYAFRDETAKCSAQNDTV